MTPAERQQLWRQRQRDGMDPLLVDVDLVRLTEWLIAAGLLMPDDQDDKRKVAEAFWRAALLSIEAWERDIP